MAAPSGAGAAPLCRGPLDHCQPPPDRGL